MWVRFQLLEKNRAEIMNHLASLPEELIHQSQQNKWSMMQAMKHVQLAEAGSISYMHKKILAGDAMKSAALMPRLLLTLVDGAFRSGLKFKAPTAIQNPTVTSLSDLKTDWDATRESLRQFVENYPEKWANKAVYKHPFVGMLSLREALRFFHIHQSQHIRQVYRIARSLKS